MCLVRRQHGILLLYSTIHDHANNTHVLDQILFISTHFKPTTMKRKFDEGESKVKPKKAKKQRVLTKEQQEQKRKKDAEARKRNAEHKKSVDEAQKKNREEKKRGQVKCAKQVHYRDTSGQDKRWPNTPGFLNVSVCSGSKKWSNLSPMKLGPIEHKETVSETDTKRLPPAHNLENAWQGSKVRF